MNSFFHNFVDKVVDNGVYKLKLSTPDGLCRIRIGDINMLLQAF